jgi:hypothetical protein
MSLPNNGKNIIVLKEGQISPYIESLPQPHVNYVEHTAHTKSGGVN